PLAPPDAAATPTRRSSDRLIPADLAHIKIRRLGMRKIQPADGGRRVHCEALGQLNTGRPLGIQKLPDERLFRVIRTGWIPRRGPDRKSTRLNSSHVKISYA